MSHQHHHIDPFDSFDSNVPYWLQPDDASQPIAASKAATATPKPAQTPVKRTVVVGEVVDAAPVPVRHAAAIDDIDIASMDSFPCSDPPAFTRSHA